MATAKKKNPAPVSTGVEWDRAILAGIGAPATKANIFFIDLWRRIEGGPADNPLNTTLNTANVVGTVNSAGVKRYNSVQAGIDATVQTLKAPYYKQVVALFQSGKATAPQLATAVSTSPWDGGHYGARKTPSGAYIGGNLFNLTIPGPVRYKPPSLWGNPYAAPGVALFGAPGVATGAVPYVRNELSKTAQYILYGGAILGGVLLALIAFILIGADLGISALKDHPAAKGGMSLLSLPKQRAQTRETTRVSRERVQAGAESRAARERRSEEMHVEKVKLTKARATELRSRSRHRATQARLGKTEREKIQRQAYIQGATETATPNLTEARRRKSA